MSAHASALPLPLNQTGEIEKAISPVKPSARSRKTGSRRLASRVSPKLRGGRRRGSASRAARSAGGARSASGASSAGSASSARSARSASSAGASRAAGARSARSAGSAGSASRGLRSRSAGSARSARSAGSPRGTGRRRAGIVGLGRATSDNYESGHQRQEYQTNEHRTSHAYHPFFKKCAHCLKGNGVIIPNAGGKAKGAGQTIFQSRFEIGWECLRPSMKPAISSSLMGCGRRRSLSRRRISDSGGGSSPPASRAVA